MNIKHFELVAEPVKQEILPGVFIKGWGYNGSILGPTIQVYPGDLVNIRVYNHLPEATSIHWHGLDVPNVMNGVPDVEPSPRIEPGQYFDYIFRITNSPMPIDYGDIVRLRFGDIQINHHPMHLHGHQFLVEKADGNPIDPKDRIGCFWGDLGCII